MSNTLSFPVNGRQAEELITECLFAGLTPMLTSSPGVGKSSIIKLIANKLNLELIDIRLSQLESVDLNAV